MIRIGICEDLEEELKREKIMVQEIMQELGCNVQIVCCLSGEELLCEIESRGDFDILLLDIQMNGRNGVETARIIRETDHRAVMIFISMYDQYCKDIISVQPFAFVDKPVAREELKSTLAKVMEIWDRREEIFEFTFRKKKYCFLLREICYFESDKREVSVHGRDRVVSYYAKLDVVEKSLENSSVMFLRINKSFLANILYISEYHYDHVVLYNGSESTIGSKYRESVRNMCIENSSETYKAGV